MRIFGVSTVEHCSKSEMWNSMASHDISFQFDLVKLKILSLWKSYTIVRMWKTCNFFLFAHSRCKIFLYVSALQCFWARNWKLNFFTAAVSICWLGCDDFTLFNNPGVSFFYALPINYTVVFEHNFPPIFRDFFLSFALNWRKNCNDNVNVRVFFSSYFSYCIAFYTGVIR